MKVTEENFNAMINTGKPVMIDFGATWCGPCKALAPRIEEIEKEYDGKAMIGTADVDEIDNRFFATCDCWSRVTGSKCECTDEASN